MTEGEAHKETLAHGVISIRHRLKGLLLLVNFLVLGHVGFVGEVVEVACVCFRVQLWYEGGFGFTEDGPVHLGKVGVLVDVLDVRKAFRAGVDAARR